MVRNVPMPNLEIECPACKVRLPLPYSDTTPNEEGLTVHYDESFVREHMEMHSCCGCTWLGERWVLDPFCHFHGVPF